MSEYEDQLKRVYEASARFRANSSVQAEELIKAGNYQGAVDTMHKMIDGIDAKNIIVDSAREQVSQIVTKGLEVPKHTSSNHLPNGISKGKGAAIIAGIAIVGGGIALYNHYQHKKRESWAARIEQERIQSPKQVKSI